METHVEHGAQGEHGVGFNNDYKEINNDSLINGLTGYQGNPSDMNGDYSNTDNLMTMETNTDHSIAGAETSTHEDTNL